MDFALIIKASMLWILKILPISRVKMYECFNILGFKLYHLVHQCFYISCFNSFTVYIRYRTKNLKRFIQGLVFKGILKGQESKSWDFFEGPRRFRGPQKSENFYFSKRTKTSVDHKFKSFAINWPQISIETLKFAQY